MSGLMGNNAQTKLWLKVPLSDLNLIWDNKRIPINNTERNQRINDKSLNELYPYYGATGQVGLIDGFLFDGEYLLVGEDG